jgi:phosphomannomutase
LDCVGGIQVTASHYPLPYNGFILSGPKGRAIASATGLDDIRRIASTLRVGKTGLRGTTRPADLWSDYRRHVLSFLELSRKIRVVVDASNGVAGWMVPAIFDRIPQLEIVPLLFETTGNFVHAPDPLRAENLTLLREKVTASMADLGVCFDGDADCCVFTDEQGAVIRPDVMTALMASYLLRGRAGATIAHDVRSSKVVAETIARAGGKPQRERAGNICMRKALADGGAIFGGELSGRYYFGDNFNADSGAIMLARVLSLIASQTNRLSELVKPLLGGAHSGELSFEIDDRDARIRDIADKYRKHQIDYLDGITVDGGEWWFNLRKSNGEARLRLNVEATTEQAMQEKVEELEALLGKPV